jgi:hypothetical protein
MIHAAFIPKQSLPFISVSISVEKRFWVNADLSFVLVLGRFQKDLIFHNMILF